MTMIRSAGGEPGESSTSAAAARATMGQRRSGTAAATRGAGVDTVDADVDALAVDTGAQRARSMAAGIFRRAEQLTTLLNDEERAGAERREPARGEARGKEEKRASDLLKGVEVELQFFFRRRRIFHSLFPSNSSFAGTFRFSPWRPQRAQEFRSVQENNLLSLTQAYKHSRSQLPWLVQKEKRK